VSIEDVSIIISRVDSYDKAGSLAARQIAGPPLSEVLKSISLRPIPASWTMTKRLRTAMRSCSFWARARSVSRLRFPSERPVNDGVRRRRESQMRFHAIKRKIQDPRMVYMELIVDSDWRPLPFRCGRHAPCPALWMLVLLTACE
jgi:hypothetical protein